VAFTEDLAAFFDVTYGFAIAATLQGGTAGGVSVIKDEEFLRAHDMVTTTDPVCLVMASAVAQADVNKTLTIDGTAYTIRDRRLIDDGALALLQLEAP
jgi:hypothetical protein